MKRELLKLAAIIAKAVSRRNFDIPKYIHINSDETWQQNNSFLILANAVVTSPQLMNSE